ncbi:hypothetical protein A8709_31165 [Paenibacillus pectinilyticus]|uniref:Uncharacterized protein n=1 Tax=Paenibacillus pectinilyticus TaxID=512399 RepID=A0A1C0ZW18_9BACL|nr:hypothetical protein [Paenibacillus pectinilyticus]OCT12295.1 hypothetical protein A8709_31165 [Paenibacillus pectinilyticus]
MTRSMVKATESRGSRKETTASHDTNQELGQLPIMRGGIQGIMGLQATIGNRAVAQLMREQTRGSSPQGIRQLQQTGAQAQGGLFVQRLPSFKSEDDAIIYFEEWEEDTLFTEHAREVKQLLQVAKKMGWEDLQERIEYAQSQSEIVAIEKFQSWDLSNSDKLPAALKLLEMAQDKGWDDLENLVIKYVRKSEDTRDEPLMPSDGLLPMQREFLKRWTPVSPIPAQDLKKLVIFGGDTMEGLNWLQVLLQLPIPALTIDQFKLITTYQGDLLTNMPALRRVVDIVQGSPTTEEARGHIEAVKEFNYDISFALEAVAGSSEHADRVRDTNIQQIRETRDKKKQDVWDSHYEEAFKVLTRNEKKEINIASKQAELKKRVENKQRQLSQGKMDAIDEKALDAERDVKLIVGPEAYAKRRNEYLAFFQKVQYHPATIPALTICGQNFKIAEQIIQHVQVAPNLLMFIEHEDTTLQMYNRCLQVLPPATLHAILGLIDCSELLGFAVSEPCLQLLGMLHTDNVPVPHMKQLVHHADLLVYAKPAFAADYSLLLVHYTPDQISNLVKETPDGGQTEIRFLRTLRPKAASAADLLACLRLAKKMRWDQGILTTQIGGRPPGQTALQLTTHMYNQQLTIFDRDTEFKKWINTLCVLMEDENYTVDVGNSYQLSGNNTYERTCNIFDNTGAFLNDFVVHYHPGAVVNAQHPYGSKAHIKPHPGNATTIRIGRDELKDVLKTEIPSKK